MSQPPQMTPPVLNYVVPPVRTDLRTIAVRQKAIMFCILAQIALVALRFATAQILGLSLLIALCSLAVSIVGAFFIFMLCTAIYNTGIGILLGILTLIPLVGLVVLLIVNGKATKILREHGIKVGLLGANAKQIPSPGQIPVP